MKQLVVMLMMMMLVGCSTKPHSYDTGRIIAKHPPPIDARLTLMPDKSYKLVTYNKSSDAFETETGRWWKVEDRVAMLLPDDSGKKQRFAHTLEEPIALDFRTLWLFDELMPALEEPKPYVYQVVEEPVPNEQTEDQARSQELRAVLKKMNPGPLTTEEYRSLTRHPYSREPFLDHELASQTYFTGFRSGFSTRTREPGQLVFNGRSSGSMIDAARDAGFSAGITGDLSQLTKSELQEVTEWEQRYEEVSMWPCLPNAESDLKIKLYQMLESKITEPD